MYTQRLEDLAKQGDAQAQVDLALCYLRGDGIASDLHIAIRWLTQAAEQGSVRAQAFLCRALQMRAAGDLLAATHWGEKAVGAGDLDAHVYLSQLYLGTTLPLNTDRAEDLLGMAAYGGHGKAQYHLGRLLLEKSDNITQLEQGVHWLNQAAKSGDSEAVYELARAYREGLGIAPNQEMSNRLMKEAAHGGSGRAQAVMALDYLLEKHPDHWVKGLHWLVTAQKHGEPEVKVLIKDTIDKLMVFAEAGPAQRQFFVAERFKQGDIVEANPATAFNWCQQAAEGEWLPAQLELAKMYETGIGCQTDKESARLWRERAQELAKKPPPPPLPDLDSSGSHTLPAHITPAGSFAVFAAVESGKSKQDADEKPAGEPEGWIME